MNNLKRFYAISFDSVRFIGPVDNVPAFLDELDICVFTSVTEASPTSVWEALAMAKPVVTADAGSVSQYIENGVSGFVVPVADVHQLVRCVEILMNESALRKSIGDAARQVAIRNLSIETAAYKHASIYRRIIQNVNQ